jgi:UDP-MurNAc hydroxylase
MHFQILSHAGMLVSGAGKQLLFDPWLIGSAYWRSWWNYPPVRKELVASLQPDFIYLTHIHWDHFHGPSLRKFRKDTPILIPRGNCDRSKRDLHNMGFKNVRELRHGESFELAPGFKITSYHFYPFTDSAAVVECEGSVLFNANDAKFMGGPLKQILRRHPSIDFVFRSHSSANPRLCFDYIDGPARNSDEPERYLRDFAAFAVATGARYAVPFASNHCFLHRETYHLNDSVVTPMQVEHYFRAREIPGPELKVMVSGDSWSSRTGFAITDGMHFVERERSLEAYADEQAPKLEASYAREAAVDVTLSEVGTYFQRFIASLPWVARRLFKGKPVTYVLTGRRLRCFRVDFYRGKVEETEMLDDRDHPLQVHTSGFILRQCMARGLFIALGISKRVLFRARRADARLIWLLITLFDLYETEMLPLRRILSPRMAATWIPRWREILLYARILTRKAMGKPFDMLDYLRCEGNESWLGAEARPWHGERAQMRRGVFAEPLN